MPAWVVLREAHVLGFVGFAGFVGLVGCVGFVGFVGLKCVGFGA